VKSSLFPIAVLLARGKPIALAPTVLANLYNDLSLFKKQIVDLKKCPSSELDVIVQSPFYLVQVWVWERFKNLQPKPMLINKGDHVLLRWHMVRPLKNKNVRLELDSAINDFIWRPYVQYADKCRLFYPNAETSVPFKKDLLDEQMLSFVICLRVSELVGFESIEQYLPHRVAMQFGFDQDVPGYVSRFNDTKAIAWKNYSRPFSDSDKSLYFPSRFFKADVTTRYANWWKKSVSRPQGFVKNVVPQKRSATSSSKCRLHSKIPHEFPNLKLVGCTVSIGKSCGYGSETSKGYIIVSDVVPSKFVPKLLKTTSSENSVQDCYGSKISKGDNIVDDDVPPEFPPPKHVDCTVTTGKSCDDGSKTSKGDNIIHDDVPHESPPPKLVDCTVTNGKYCGDGSKTSKGDDNIVSDDVPSDFVPKHLKTMSSENSVQDGLEARGNIDAGAPSSSPPKQNTFLTPLISFENCKHVLEDGNASKEARLSSDIICESRTQEGSYSGSCEAIAAELEERLSRLERKHRELKMARLDFLKTLLVHQIITLLLVYILLVY
jgi:hypothetical protein